MYNFIKFENRGISVAYCTQLFIDASKYTTYAHSYSQNISHAYCKLLYYINLPV